MPEETGGTGMQPHAADRRIGERLFSRGGLTVSFKKATRSQSKLRLGLIGPAGSGKTMTALRVARGLAGPTGRIAVIDTERGSASLYAGERELDFDVNELDSYEAQKFLDGIRDAVAGGYDVLVIDSLSHAWAGKGGILEFVDSRKSQGGGGIDAWGKATPLQNAIRDGILSAPLHVICTMRSKVEYVVEKEPSGRTTVRKVGLQPVQREGMEYEFDVVGDVTSDHALVVTKTRAAFLKDATIREAGEDLGRQLLEWLNVGTPAPAAVKVNVPHKPGAVAARARRAIEAADNPDKVASIRHKIDQYLAAGELGNDEVFALLEQLDARESEILNFLEKETA
jgi:hypothetical protein